MDKQVCGIMHRVLGLFIAGFFVCSPVCAIHIMAFEQSDRTAPVAQALIYLDNEYVGFTDLNGTYNLTYEGEPPSLRVAKAGYREWTGIPALNDTLLLVPLQVRNCTYSVQVFDADTLLPIDGAQVKIGFEDTLIQQGQTSSNGTVSLPLRSEQVYDLTISMRNYQVVREKLITGFENADVQYSLIRTDRISLQVKDSQDGRFIADVDIFINNKPSGRTNGKGILITNLTRGMNYSIEATAPGYEKNQIQATPDIDDQILDLTLARQKTPAFIAVYDQDKKPVEGAGITIDGNETGYTNLYGRLTVPDLEVRTYNVSVSKEGYQSQSRSLIFSSDEPDIIFDIKPEAVLISFRVEDPAHLPLSNASVLVNGTENGTTDATGTVNITLKEGKMYLVSASAPGYDANNTTIIPPVSSPVNISLRRSKQVAADMSSGLIILISGLAGAVVIGVLYFVFWRKKQSRSQKKRISLRKRSL